MQPRIIRKATTKCFFVGFLGFGAMERFLNYSFRKLISAFIWQLKHTYFVEA